VDPVPVAQTLVQDIEETAARRLDLPIDENSTTIEGPLTTYKNSCENPGPHIVEKEFEKNSKSVELEEEITACAIENNHGTVMEHEKNIPDPSQTKLDGKLHPDYHLRENNAETEKRDLEIQQGDECLKSLEGFPNVNAEGQTGELLAHRAFSSYISVGECSAPDKNKHDISTNSDIGMFRSNSREKIEEKKSIILRHRNQLETSESISPEKTIWIPSLKAQMSVDVTGKGRRSEVEYQNRLESNKTANKLLR